MSSESTEDTKSWQLDQLCDEVRKQKQQLESLETDMNLLSNRIDILLERTDLLAQAQHWKYSFRIGSSLNRVARVLVIVFVLLLVGSAVSLAVSFGGFSELLADFSFLCISLAVVAEVLSMLISPAKQKRTL